MNYYYLHVYIDTNAVDSWLVLVDFLNSNANLRIQFSIGDFCKGIEWTDLPDLWR